VHDRSIKLRYGRNLVTKHSTFSYPSCDYIINIVLSKLICRSFNNLTGSIFQKYKFFKGSLARLDNKEILIFPNQLSRSHFRIQKSLNLLLSDKKKTIRKKFQCRINKTLEKRPYPISIN
jgi:hypothetical protein